MRLGVVTALVALTGCDRVFGLERGPDPNLDAPPPEHVVTGHAGYFVIEPDDLGGYQPARPQDLPIEATVELEDGTPSEVIVAGDLSFSFGRTRDDQPYRLRYRFAGSGSEWLTLVSSAAELQLLGPLFGRYDRTPVPPNTKLTVTLPQTTQQTYAFTTGLRTIALVNESPTPLTTFSLDWTQVASLSGPVGLPMASAHDTLYVADYRLIGGVGAYYAIDHIGSSPLTLPPGVTTTIALTTQMPALGRCVRLTAGRAAEQARLLATVAGSMSPKALWSIEATPDPLATSGGGIVLAYENTTVSADFMQDVAYANPLLGERQVVRVAVSAEVEVTPGTRMVVATDHLAPLPLTSTCSASSAVAITGTVAIATNLALDGQPLDGAIDVTARHLTFESTAGAADLFQIDVFELGVAAGVAHYVTTTPDVILDADVLLPGTTYVLRVVTYQGYPGAATGDLQHISYPTGRSTIHSHAFTVR